MPLSVPLRVGSGYTTHCATGFVRVPHMHVYAAHSLTSNKHEIYATASRDTTMAMTMNFCGSASHGMGYVNMRAYATKQQQRQRHLSH